MKINLITPEQHETLLNIQKEFPKLTFQNEGYQYLKIESLTEEEKEKLNEIKEILNTSIIGFSKFNNFKLDKNNKINLRFQYDYDADNDGPGNKTPFVGVGYIKLDELLNGFKN